MKLLQLVVHIDRAFHVLANPEGHLALNKKIRWRHVNCAPTDIISFITAGITVRRLYLVLNTRTVPVFVSCTPSIILAATLFRSHNMQLNTAVPHTCLFIPDMPQEHRYQASGTSYGVAHTWLYAAVYSLAFAHDLPPSLDLVLILSSRPKLPPHPRTAVRSRRPWRTLG